MGVKAQPVWNALSHTHTHTPWSALCLASLRSSGRLSRPATAEVGGYSPCQSPEAESDMFVFVGCSLTKCLKWANESGAYPAKLLLDGAESAQMFYDTPVMRFHIDLTALSRTAGSSLFSILTDTVRFRLPFIWLDSLVLEGLSWTDRWPSWAYHSKTSSAIQKLHYLADSNKTKEMAGLYLEGKEKSSQKCILKDQSQYTMCNARIYYGNVTFYKTSISPVTNWHLEWIHNAIIPGCFT